MYGDYGRWGWRTRKSVWRTRDRWPRRGSTQAARSPAAHHGSGSYHSPFVAPLKANQERRRAARHPDERGDGCESNPRLIPIGIEHAQQAAAEQAKERPACQSEGPGEKREKDHHSTVPAMLRFFGETSLGTGPGSLHQASRRLRGWHAAQGSREQTPVVEFRGPAAAGTDVARNPVFV